MTIACRITAVALLLNVTAACADPPVYRCVDDAGHVAFQAIRCAPSQRENEVVIRPAPPPSPSPDYGIGKRSRASAKRGREVAHRAEPESSFECRVANGEVFYQHGPCPSAVLPDPTIADTRASKRKGKGKGKSNDGLLPVSARAIARKDACRRIHAASASGRPGHRRDEDVSTYERNLGRDPCR